MGGKVNRETRFSHSCCSHYEHHFLVVELCDDPEDKTERIRRFVRGLTFSIRSAVFRASREGASFQSIVSAAKKEELMEREEFGNPKRVRTAGQFHGVSSGGRGSHRESGSFQQ
ncbi:hypothetical protein H5410_001645 [Solanum commersonii]|uniref:Uncharacterized protein n=1 Tax=Solanum commersonii TaxID=4109 RepID=A0A9J6AZL7_SOLCO|nr:hypothetical protein H5410_001645 [Solanum commersonii]